MSLAPRPKNVFHTANTPVVDEYKVSASPLYPDKSDGEARLSPDELEAYRRKDAKLKHQIRIFRFLTRFLSVILSAVVLTTMSFTIARYFTTRTHISPATHTPVWPNPTILWPTYMLLGVSFITFSMNTVVLLSYCCGIKRANAISSVNGLVSIGLLLTQLVAWAVSTGLFKMANTGNDLWGWSCGGSDAIEQEVRSFLDFGQLCTVNTGGWGITAASAAFYLITAIMYGVVARRVFHKRKMEGALGFDGTDTFDEI